MASKVAISVTQKDPSEKKIQKFLLFTRHTGMNSQMSLWKKLALKKISTRKKFQKKSLAPKNFKVTFHSGHLYGE